MFLTHAKSKASESKEKKSWKKLVPHQIFPLLPVGGKIKKYLAYT